MISRTTPVRTINQKKVHLHQDQRQIKVATGLNFTFNKLGGVYAQDAVQLQSMSL